jgi:hypothetical protein
MGAMKDNYQELTSNANHTGSYVGFVQQVVEYLQQYTVDIIPVDKYFIDSATFPLPAMDPTYVVGKLKHYGLNLGQTQYQTQLIAFLNTTAEKAVMENHQEYLMGQLTTAMVGCSGLGNKGKTELRLFFLQAIVPAYLLAAFGRPQGEILIVPILQATSNIFELIVEDTDPCNARSTDYALKEVEALVSTTYIGLVEILVSLSSYMF